MNNNYYEQEELWNRELTFQETERIDIVKKFIPNDVKTILDAGCGNGAISNYLDGFNITAMDRSHEALKYVKNKSVEGSLDSLPFEDNSFDLIICSDVLEHLPDDIYKKTIKEFKRVSKKYILIISPNSENLEANQSKCIKCGTVFHMNWHISSISVDKILNNFRDDFSPVYYSFFGDKWASESQIKYTLARTTSRGYKHWENAVCPMCSTKQKGSQENSKDIDIECNRFLNGFYNHSTEFIVLLSTIENKKEIFDFDDIEENILLSKREIRNLNYANRQSIISKHNTFRKKHTEFYPQYAYIVDGASSNEENRRLVCFPYLKNSQKIYFEFQDNNDANILVNVYDLEKYFINIGTINLLSDNQRKKISFEIPDDIIPANEGLIFELISDNEKVFEEFVFDKIYIDDDFGDVTFSEQKEVEFFANKYLAYKYDYAKKDDCFLVLGKDVLVYDEKNRCFFMNLSDSFEFFVSSKNSKQELDTIKEELNKQSNTSKQELDTIKEELNKQSNTSKQELDTIKEELNKQSNTSKQELDTIKEELNKQSNTSKQELDTIKEELNKQSNTSKQELDTIKEELNKQSNTSKQELDTIKEELNKQSNTSKQELDTIKEELNKQSNTSKQELDTIKEELNKQSNTSKQELDTIKEELNKQSNTSKQELDTIKEELNKQSNTSKQELDTIKEELNKQSNTSKQELDTIKEELNKQSNTSKQELDTIKEELNKQSNTSKQELDTIKEELNKQSNTSKQELDTIKEELNKQSNTSKQELFSEIESLKEELQKINKEMYHLKVGVYNISNAHESLVKRLRNPLNYIFGRLKNKFLPKAKIKETKKDNSKHLVVITPDVRIDRRTVQMCQSLIKSYGIKCTIIAALEEKDDFVTDKLKVKRIDPYKTEKYILKPDDWNDGATLNLEDFYWLHPHYLNMALCEDADYIMCCDLPVLPAAVYASKIKNIPLIYDAHELYPEQAIFPEEKREFYTQVEANFIKYPDLVITVNESIAEEMAKRYEINKPEVILNALDAPSSFDINKKYDYFREKLPIAKEQKIVLFQGGYSPNRNLELFVKSAKYIKDDSVVLVLMGFGDFGQILEDIAKEDKTINKKVFFFPAVDQSVLLEYSASADVGIIPYPHIDLNSYYCTPNKLFEFIQAGLPMIANDSPELNRFVKANNIGYSKKIESEQDIASMIDEYFSQNIEYKKNMQEVQKTICWNVEEKKFNKMMKGII